MFKITREFHFSAGHTLRNYVGKCANLHGHNYRCLVTLEGIPNIEVDMLIDFGDFKDGVEFILEKYDHHFLIDFRDERCEALKAIDPTVLELPYNPTAEALARDIQDKILGAFFPGYMPNKVFNPGLNHYKPGQPMIMDVTVQLWETDNCSAISTSKDNYYGTIDDEFGDFVGCDDVRRPALEDSMRPPGSEIRLGSFLGMDTRQAKLKLFEAEWEEWKGIWEETFDMRGRKRLWMDKGAGDVVSTSNPYDEAEERLQLKGSYPHWNRPSAYNPEYYKSQGE